MCEVEGNAYLNFSEKNRENIRMLMLIVMDSVFNYAKTILINREANIQFQRQKLSVFVTWKSIIIDWERIIFSKKLNNKNNSLYLERRRITKNNIFWLELSISSIFFHFNSFICIFCIFFSISFSVYFYSLSLLLFSFLNFYHIIFNF